MVHNEFVLSEKGASRMDFHHQWEYEEAPKRGLRNPWNHRPDKPTYQRETIYLDPNNKKHGIQMKRSIYPKVNEEEMTAWKIERDEYMRQRDEWIALQMFNKYGYETFIEECEAYHLTDEFRNSVRPCESRNDSQCNLFCRDYGNCTLRLGETQTQNGGKDRENRKR